MLTPLVGADPVALAQALVRCPSVTPHEGRALALLATELAAAGFTVHRPVFSEAGYPDVHNLYARFGSASPVFVIAGHTDVVPPGDTARWAGPGAGGRGSLCGERSRELGSGTER
jgi:succinyl-diaminopimelate desuccinylase